MKEEIINKIKEYKKAMLKTNSPYLRKDYTKAINKLLKKLEKIDNPK